YFRPKKESNKLVVIDFTVTWCAPFYAQLVKKCTPFVIFPKVDIEEVKSALQDWAIEAMPAFVFLKEGGADDED
ncbi:hypothetical protein OPV22_003463, partial [Ensete ventricosum]